MAKPAKEAPLAHTGAPLVELTLEALNHEKALLKLKLHEKGKQSRQLQKEMGDLNSAYTAIDQEMLRRDERYNQGMLELEEAKE